MRDTRPEPDGMLSAADREYLHQKEDFGSRGSRSNRRSAIRARVRNTLLDFSVLAEHLSPEGRRRALTPADNDEDALHPHELEVSLIDLTAFLYSACQDTSIRFEQVIRSGVYEAYPDHHRDRVLQGVNVDIDYEELDLLAKTAWIDWEDDNPLSPQEAAVLMESGEDLFGDEDLPELRDRVRRHREGGSALKREREDRAQPQFMTVESGGEDDPDEVIPVEGALNLREAIDDLRPAERGDSSTGEGSEDDDDNGDEES